MISSKDLNGVKELKFPEGLKSYYVKLYDKRNENLEEGEDIFPPPEYATNGSSGVDLYPLIDDPEETWKLSAGTKKYSVINPGKTKLVKTGLHVEIPLGFELQIRSKSGLALKKGIAVLNSPFGTVDSDYRGEIGVILHNFSNEQFLYYEDTKIAQAVLAEVNHIDWVHVSSLSELSGTKRGEGGFGSTGK